MKSYLHLQKRMLERKLVEFGVHPLLGYFLILVFFLILSELIFFKLGYAAFIYAFLGLSLLPYLGESKRNEFLKNIFSSKQYIETRLLENILAILPFTLFLFYKNCYLIGFAIFILSCLVSLINFANKLNWTLPTPFTKKPFEFTVGFRKTWAVLALAYFLCFMAINVANFNLGVFALAVVFFTSMSFYYEPENTYFVWIHSSDPKSFLTKKIYNALVQSTILSIPISVILGLFFQENIPIILTIQILGYIYLITIILAKYSSFPGFLSVPQGLIVAASFVLPPLLLVIIPYLYKKSLYRLKLLLE